MSAGYEKPPCGPVSDGSVNPSTRIRAPETGDLPSRTFPNVKSQLDEFGFHGLTTSARLILIRADPVACAAALRRRAAGVVSRAGVTATLGAVAAAAVLRNAGRFGGGGKSVLSPPTAKTISPGRTPPFEDVGVPPIVTATYSLPPTE